MKTSTRPMLRFLIALIFFLVASVSRAVAVSDDNNLRTPPAEMLQPSAAQSPVSSEPVFRETPISVDYTQDIKIDEPFLRKQTFIPDAPQFRLPDIPNIFFAAPALSYSRINIYWLGGNFDSGVSGFDYSNRTSSSAVAVSAEISGSSGQSADGFPLRRLRRFLALWEISPSDYFAATASASASESSLGPLDRARASGEFASEYHPSDGLVFSSRVFAKRTAAGVSADFFSGDAEARYIPNDETSVYARATAHRQRGAFDKNFESPRVGVEKLFFRRALVSCEAGREYGEFHSDASASLKMKEGVKIFLRHRSGYDAVTLDDIFPDELISRYAPVVNYPKTVSDRSGGAEWYIARSRGYAKIYYFDKKIENYFYLAADSGRAALHPAAMPEAQMSGVSAAGEYRLGNFEFTTDFLYNTREVIPGFPKIKTVSALGYSASRLAVKVYFSVETDRVFSAAPAIKCADKSVVDLSCRFTAVESLEILAQVKNIFSSTYEIQPAVSSEKPEYLVGIKASF